MGNTTNSYNANRSLSSEDSTNFGYDWVSNRVNPPANPNPMVYNAADQLTAWPGQHTYTYLGTGSLYHQYDSTGATVQKTYAYTPANLLSSVTHQGVTGQSLMSWDADGNRVSFTSSTNPGNPHTFVYDTTAGIPAVIEEVKPSGATGGSGTVYYIREPNGALIARVEGSTIQYYHFDALGSTRLLTSGTGAPTDSYIYDAWGKLTSHTGSTLQPYLFVGQLGYYSHYQDDNLFDDPNDPNTGWQLLQLGVRFYDPALGRFTQVDPVAFLRESTYSYASSTPIRMIDPKGTFPFPTGMEHILSCLGGSLGRAVALHHVNDKLSHCYLACMIARCTGTASFGTGTWIMDHFVNLGRPEDDPADSLANEFGGNCAKELRCWPLGKKGTVDCYTCCVKAVDILPNDRGPVAGSTPQEGR